MFVSHYHAPDWLSDLAKFCVATGKKAVNYLTGGVCVAIATVYYDLGNTLKFSIIWSLVSLAFFVAAFRAWRDQYQALQTVLHAQEKEGVLKRAADFVRQKKEELEKKHTPFSASLYALPGLLKAGGDELNSLHDLVWVCDEMVRYKFTHPFAAFTGTSNTLVKKEEWLKFLRELRIGRGKDITPTGALDFWWKHWKDRDKA